MISTLSTLNPYSYGAFASGGASGKLYVPVSPAAVIYAQFDHISGIAAGHGENGVSVSKIQILNSLIEHLSAMKNMPKSDVTGISDKQADVLIKNYQKQIQQAVHDTPFMLSGARPQAGALFTIQA